MPAFRFAAIAALVILAADAAVITFVMRPLFQAALGNTMLDTLRLGPAALFYLIHVAGLTYFAAGAASPRDAARDGAMLGFVSYSCYEMTSWTIMRDWSAHLVAVDLAWGTIISGVAAGVAARFRKPA
jgi:uncharacterized membrane protein